MPPREARVLAPTKSQNDHWEREARNADRERTRAYESGKRGEDPTHDPSDEQANQAYESGLAEHRAEKASTRRQAAIGPAKEHAVNIAQEGAGFLLGMGTYALVLAFLNHGWPGVWGWLSAKFVNKPMPKGKP